MLTGDDTPAPTGEADPGQGAATEAPASTPDTPSPADDYKDRYENLHRAFGSQGNELGSLRQKLSTYEQELADLRAWRKEQERARTPDQYERESRLNRVIKDPDGWRDEGIDAKLTPLQKEIEELRSWREQQREQAMVSMVEEFKRENPAAVKYAEEINARLQHIPRKHLTKGLLEDAYFAAERRAGKRAEESAQKKVEALTRTAALPKGVASPKGNSPARKARSFDEAVMIAKAKAEAGG